MRTGWHLDLCFLSARWECVKLWCSIGLFAGTTSMCWLIQAGIKGMLRCFKCENWSFSCSSLCSWKRARWSVSCCLFSEPSGMPAGVWARSVSASEIEVNWQALSYSPERVLGYEVYFTLLNGNRNLYHTQIHKNTHTYHISNVCYHPCCTWEPSLTAKIIQFFVPRWQEKHITVFPRGKRKLPVHMPFRVAVSHGVVLYRASW